MKKILFIVLLSVATVSRLAAQCNTVNCSGTTASGTNASAIGTNTTASGHSAFASGNLTQATGNFSSAIGANVTATADLSIVIGRFLQAGGGQSIVIGSGKNNTTRLINGFSNTLMIGFSSDKPTFFVSETPYGFQTGKIGIGNVTSPLAKIHLLSDVNEAAILRLEHQTSGTGQYAQMLLGTHSIRAGNNENMVFTTPDPNKNFLFVNGKVGIGNSFNPSAALHVRAQAEEDARLLLEATGERSRAILNFSGGDGYIGTTSEGKSINFTIGETIRMTVQRMNGFVGIGTTTPNANLHVVGNVNVAGNILINNNSTITSDRLGRFANGSAGAPAYSFSENTTTGMYKPSNNILAFSTNGSEKIRISTNGNVGVGMINPASKLQVNGNAAIGYVSATSAPSNGLVVSGNVGIGTSNPTAKLEVTGQIKITGGNPGVSKVLTSDASGLASWETLSAVNITSGTLPVARGGTGLSSVNSGRILFGGSDALSTSDNLYWDNSSERLGIGTTTPGAALHIRREGINTKYGYVNRIELAGNVDSIHLTKAFDIKVVNSGSNTTIDDIFVIWGSGNITTKGNSFHFNNDGNSDVTSTIRTDAGPLRFQTGSSNTRVTITEEGNVGIGTSNPQRKLEVAGDIEFTGDLYKNGQIFSGSKWTVSGNNVYRNVGNVGIGTDDPKAKLQVQCFKAGSYSSNHNDYLVAYTGFGIGWDGNQWRTPGDGANNAAGMIASSIGSGKMYFYTFPRTGTGDQAINDSELNNYRRLTITNNGYVGIGTTSPEALLHVNGSVKINSNLNATQVNVNGTIYAKQIRVRQNVPNSDHVFKKDYYLMPLRDVEQFIRKYGHLPEVPSAVEFQEDGYLVGDMDDLLLRKIEELTLHIIELNKQFEALELEFSKLKNKDN